MTHFTLEELAAVNEAYLLCMTLCESTRVGLSAKMDALLREAVRDYTVLPQARAHIADAFAGGYAQPHRSIDSVCELPRPLLAACMLGAFCRRTLGVKFIPELAQRAYLLSVFAGTLGLGLYNQPNQPKVVK